MPSKKYARQLPHIRRAAEWIDNYKLAAGCVDCGFDRWPEALHFDHVSPEDKHLHPGWIRNRTRINNVEKLEKFIEHVQRFCVVRCANCHAHRSASEGHYWGGAAAEVEEDPRLPGFDVA